MPPQQTLQVVRVFIAPPDIVLGKVSLKLKNAAQLLDFHCGAWRRIWLAAEVYQQPGLLLTLPTRVGAAEFQLRPGGAKSPPENADKRIKPIQAFRGGWFDPFRAKARLGIGVPVTEL